VYCRNPKVGRAAATLRQAQGRPFDSAPAFAKTRQAGQAKSKEKTELTEMNIDNITLIGNNPVII